MKKIFNPLTPPFDNVPSTLADIDTRTHSLLSSLTADDHTQYALLAGRSGGQVLKGGTASGNTLDLTSNPINPLSTPITLNAPLQFLPSATTYSAAGSSFIGFGSSIIVDYANGALPSVLTFNPVVQFNQSANAFGAASLFVNAATVKNVAGVVANLGPVYTLVASPTVQADGATISQSIHYGVFEQTTLSTINSGVLLNGGLLHFAAAGTIGSGVISTSRRGFNVDDVGGTGTVFTNYGINIASLTRGRDKNYAIYTNTGLVRAGDDIEVDNLGKGYVDHDSGDTRRRMMVTTGGAVNVEELDFDPLIDIDWYAAYRPSLITGVADGGSISRLADSTGNNRDATEATTGNQPTYEDSRATLNSKPAVRFTAANSQRLSLTGASITAATGYTLLTVVEFATVAALQRIFGHATNATSRGFGITATPNWTAQMGGVTASAGTPAATTKYFVRVYATSTSYSIYVNEVLIATTATAANNLNQIILGAGRTGAGVYGNYFDGWLGDVYVYSGDVTAHAQWTRMKAYMNSYYGFTL